MSPERRASREQWEQYLERVETWAQHALNSAYVGEEPQAGDLPEQPAYELPPEFADRARHAALSLKQAAQEARLAQADVGRQISALRNAPAPHDAPDTARYLDVSG